MIIQNYRELAQNRTKKHALQILESGLEAAAPNIGLEKYIKKGKIKIDSTEFLSENYTAIHLVAFGKAADYMAKTVNFLLDVKSGFIVIPKGSKSVLSGKKFQIFNASHPTPNQTSVDAAKAIQKFLKRRKKSELVIFLVSGGGSSLVCLPDGVDLSDKMYANDLLLKSGATIQEFNCVRKHLSQIKGGRLVQGLACDAISLIMSDVDDNDLSAISSGTTYCDNTTFSDALKIIRKYNLVKKMPENVMNRIFDGVNGKISETPKEPVIPNYIVASNQDCIDAMIKKAKDFGYSAKVLKVSGNIKDATQKILKELPSSKSVLIFGGETTVEVLGNGKGGRNQEIVLRLLKNMQKLDSKFVVASIGTDGIDGNTEYAGAISSSEIDVSTVNKYLMNSNSSEFFAKTKGLVKTGYTHTNLQDIGIIIPQ
ncbi:MAG: DUF4147 domain-containing protein [Crenarchaeota archaeon]|nr:MAG: DUF4147 domain-containing protein [Thermoproteota archaeon]RDJ32863.1 MAG: DUF4147 domain-containing protein [Thermoproteota archaeon]RDJ38032.1 MAG: DUF4147 domain-containing protein [Thermoproteota archaeon]RDJ38303.1 MAG: DUF4147 domain-containing protein [Thermoproteota archaeon]